MKKINLMAGLILIAAFLMVLPINASASLYSGAWQPNSDDFFVVSLSSGTGSLYLFDWGNTTNNLMILSNGSFNNSTVYFSPVGTTWWAGLTQGAQTLNLGLSNWFGFYFSDGSNPPYLSYALTSTGTDSYTLFESNTSMTVMLHDADPVPIPATVWIFGAGLMGIVGIRRKLRS